MKNQFFRYALLLVSLVALLGTVAFVFRATDIVDVAGGCQPSFADEFNGNQIDTSRWDTTYKSGKTELQVYTPDALHVSDGILHITAEQNSQGNPTYTSGMVTTQDTFSQQYGYFEMRAQISKGQGLWPAFWLLHTGLLPWNELDVFEFLGHNPNKVYLYNHWRDSANQHQSLPKFYSGPDYSIGFHTYALDWRPNGLTWYIDGIKRAQTTEHVPAEPMFILANLAVGGSWPGVPDPSTHFPAYFDIDYIRVYPANCQNDKPNGTLTPVGSAPAHPAGDLPINERQ